MISIGISWLPSDTRSLLKTPRIIHLDDCAGGKLWYRGIGSNLKSIFKHSNENISISLNFNFDGTVLFNSSSWNFWPILANIHGKYSSSLKIGYNANKSFSIELPSIQPMIIAVWCGISKPNSLSQFIHRFVEELEELMRVGLRLNSHSISVAVRSFICDTPARALIKGFFVFFLHLKI